MELILIRHGQPAWARADGTSSNDPPLTPLGVEQAQAVGRWLRRRGKHFDALHASRALRAQQTAAEISEAMGLPVTTEPWLHEIVPPDEWDGQPEDRVVATLEAMRTRPLDDWWDGNPGGGETFGEFHQRITEGVEGFIERHGGRRHRDHDRHLWEVPDGGPRLLLVAHAGSNSVITSHLLGIEPQPWEWERFPCDHASMTVLRSRAIAGADMWALEYFSGVAHLADDQVTA